MGKNGVGRAGARADDYNPFVKIVRRIGYIIFIWLCDMGIGYAFAGQNLPTFALNMCNPHSYIS